MQCICWFTYNVRSSEESTAVNNHKLSNALNVYLGHEYFSIPFTPPPPLFCGGARRAHHLT